MTPSADADPVLTPPARLRLFGFDPTDADLTVLRRSRSWRLGRTVRILALTAVAAPLVGLVPPHAPWALGAMAGGLFLARRSWMHRFSVLEMTGSCPRCGAVIAMREGTRLRFPHPVSCESCQHQPTLELPGDPLPTP